MKNLSFTKDFKFYFLFIMMVYPGVKLWGTCSVAPAISEWDWEMIMDLLESWEIPSHFEFIILTDNKMVNGVKEIQSMGRSVRIHGHNHSQFTDVWNLQNPFLVLIHIPSNLNELQEIFKEISLGYNAKLWSPKSSGTIYHVVLWPNSSSLSPLAGHDWICDYLPPDLPLIPLNSNLHILSPRRDLVFEIYHIKADFHCASTFILDEEVIGEPKFQEILRRAARRKDFNGVRIISTAAVEASTEFEVNFKEVNGNIIDAAGYAVSIFKDLEYILGFSGSFIRGDWITRDAGGNPFGLTVDQLQNKIADIYITQTSLSPYRAIGLSYIQPTFQDSIYSFVRQPPSSSVHDVHISPFQNELWMALLVVWIVLAIALYTIAHVHNAFCTPRPIPSWPKFSYLQEAFLWSLAAACNQGWYAFPKSTCCRIVIFLGSVTGFIVFIMYSGSIISSLTTETPPIQSFGDLLTSSVDIRVDNTSSTIQRILQNIRLKNPKVRPFKSSEVGVSVRSVMRRPGAVVGFARNFYGTAHRLNYSSVELCGNITKFPIMKLPVHNGMMVPLWSPFRETFNHNVMKLKELGLVARYSKHFQWDSTPSCAEKKAVYRENLGIQDVFTAFGLLLGGIAASILIFITERGKHYLDI